MQAPAIPGPPGLPRPREHVAITAGLTQRTPAAHSKPQPLGQKRRSMCPVRFVGVYGVLANPGSTLGAPITTDGGVRVGPGRYLLAFACVGTGQVDAEIWVRKASAKGRATCQRRPELVQLDLTAHQAGPVYVQFAATQRETVAIAGRAASR